jgi:hypothetical protein
MNAELKGLARYFFRLLLAFSVIFVAAYFLFERIANPPGPWTELVRANPEFDIIRTPSHGLLIMTDSAKKRAFVADSYAGDFKIEPLACEEIRKPAWFRLPADAHGETCLRVGEVAVINFLTATKIPALWKEFYEPLVRPLESNGGYSTGYHEIGPDGLLVAGTSMHYRVGDTVKISAYHLRDKTLGIVYFEPER